MNIYSLLAVGAGGFFGSVGRYLCVLYVDKTVNSHFPFGTFAVNIAGSFLLGILTGLSLADRGSFSTKLFLTTGFCGGFTTFSAFALENAGLIQQKSGGLAMLYVTTSVVLSILAIGAGLWVGKRFA